MSVVRKTEENLKLVWGGKSRQRLFTVPTTCRLIPRVDCQIQDLIKEFPHLNQTQIINDLLLDSLERLDNSMS